MRFINADNYELVSDLASSMQLNMYAYCGNNPIMYTDETGEFLLSTAVLIGAIIGGVIGATAGGIIASQFIKAAMKIWSTTTLVPIVKFYLMG